MENSHSLLVMLFFFLATLVALKPISASPPLPPPSPSPILSPPPSPPSLSLPPPSTPQQLNNIIDALIGTGDYSSWVSILATANPLALPLSATLFIPENNALNRRRPAVDPFLFPYHIVPQRLVFSDLLLFKANSRIPTLLPGNSITITNNSRSNFTIDNTPLTHFDLYTTANIAVHGVGAILDYSVYGDGLPLIRSPPPQAEKGGKANPPPSPPTRPEGILTPPFVPIGETTDVKSDAACSCTEVPLVFLIFLGVLAFKIQRIPLPR
ncbi:hypothetical protein L6164_033272 [Bauhinia variegata]|uniref:Uncharacterized protein n=1 Tax=Bauhinia variegata TaxID=167791 RepID=A0ACB9KRR8_BAUVA|nr:hypothetical protein L6164_033272 [Bauhinia variegata]